jgi:tRNA(Arg) A34 adenosine deaminase TadA
MKRALLFCCFILLIYQIEAQNDKMVLGKVDPSYFITHSRAELITKLVDLPCGIKPEDPIKTILNKLHIFLVDFQPSAEFPDDKYAKAANLQALAGVMEGGYGIGSVLIDKDGKIIEEAHNNQMQEHRSDLHAEMTLMTKFEESHKAKKYMNIYVYKPGLTVFSSAEPCPMCLIRISTAGADTKYCTPGPEDGMVSRIDFLPPDWKALALKHSVNLGDCSPVMQKISHLLFYTFLLDNRGPK